MKCQPESQSPFKPQSRFGLMDLSHDMHHPSIEQLIKGDFNARWNAAKILKSVGTDAHPALIHLLENAPADPDLLCFIADILGANPTPEGILALVNLLKTNHDEEVQQTVVLTLAKQGHVCIPQLLTYATDPELEGSVLKALIQINHPETLPGLIPFTEHQKSSFRALAFEAIGQFHGHAIRQLLMQGLQDTTSEVRAVCVKLLGFRQALEVDESLIAALGDLLYDLNESVCHEAAKALGRMNHDLALEYLWHRLVEENTPSAMTLSLIRALGWSNHPVGIQYLLELIREISSVEGLSRFGKPWPSELASELVHILGNIQSQTQNEQISQWLVGLLGSPVSPFDDASLQQTLVMAIAQLGQSEAIIPLIHCLAVEDERFRFHVIASLKLLHRDKSHETLLSYSQDSTLEVSLATGIAIALKEW